ncbi:MAG: trigger factor [Candidatus Gracilibacteria bacterium]|nr:trigger factor [Candidatus Gracilibacteria bacterium]
MEINVKKLPKAQVQITVKLSKEEQEKYEKKALDKLAKSVKMEGFRPGKVPPSLIEEKIGKEGIQAEALELALPEIYYQAILEHKLQPVAQPKADIKSKDPVEIVLTVDVMPEVKVKDWKKIKVKKVKIEVKKEELDEMIERLRAQVAEFKDVERAAQKDDRVEIDFDGFVDEKALEGGSSKNHPLVIGKSQFIPGFEENVIGMKKDESKEFDITFPKDYHKQDLQGKKATFKVKVNRVEEVVMPELKEEFVTKITGGKLKTMEELKKDLQEHMLEQKEHEDKHRIENEVLDGIAKITEMDIPESMLAEEMDFMRQDFEQRIAQYGMNMETFLVGQKKTEEDLKKDWKPEAEKRIKMRMAIQKIAEDEKVEIKPEEIEERAKRVKADAKGEELERIKNRVFYALRAERTMDQILKQLVG